MSPRTDLRCSDAERERVAGFLRDQAAEGRLTPDELDERVGAAYAAKTVRELKELVADLPRTSLPHAGPPRRTPAGRGVNPLLPIGILGFLALGGPWVMWVGAIVASTLVFTGVVVLLALGLAASPFLLVAALVILALRRRRPPRRFDPRWR
jgi:Domain of unknown function (DUF1707)